MRKEECGQAGSTATGGTAGSQSRFEDLRVWQAARELARGVYRASKSQKLRSDRVFVDQMTRAAVSVVSNIAEGHERGSRVQNIEFCCYAKGSVGELRSQVILAHDVELLDATAFAWLHQKCEEVATLLGSYVKHMRQNPRSRHRVSEKSASCRTE
jgi:four helix bundle protein